MIRLALCLVLFSSPLGASALGASAVGVSALGVSALEVSASESARELGLRLGREQRYEEAVAVLSEYLPQQPDDAAVALALALAALKIGDTGIASEALGHLPDGDPAANMLRGELSLRTGDLSAARDRLEAAWASFPPEIELDLRRLLGEVYVSLGEPGLATELLRGHEEGRPTLAVLLSRALYQQGDADGAYRALAPWAGAARSTPADAPGDEIRLATGIAVELGRALVALDRPETAEPLLRHAARLLPDNPETWNVLAHALIALGDSDGARQALGRYQALSDGVTLDP